MSAKDGGPAFPAKRKEVVGSFQGAQTLGDVEYPGMSVRDVFAGLAMLGIISCRDVVHRLIEASNGDAGAQREISRRAYAQADAMLAERAKGSKPDA